eukprot:TRINITY_DN14877_c0_g1_i1.p1 TRINITY_DN14877_c0_g1~~TRINITY_DN14877_c0_g1_i1.p1  ORF type:complete len:205 (-),score=34.55 TRINITY_DN14877_c0_g1_i1:76-690(-)
MILFFVSSLFLARCFFGEANAIADVTRRKACPHYQQMQCLLDISEKACEPDEEPLPLLDWNERESVWLCCCPLPYKPCKADQMDQVCLKSVNEHLAASKVKTSSELLAGLQKARGAMRAHGGEQCAALAPEEPLSICGFAASPPQSRSLERQDLFCEMVTWQWEELGDGNPVEFKNNGCKFEKAAKGNGNERKGQQLDGAKVEL